MRFNSVLRWTLDRGSCLVGDTVGLFCSFLFFAPGYLWGPAGVARALIFGGEERSDTGLEHVVWRLSEGLDLRVGQLCDLGFLF